MYQPTVVLWWALRAAVLEYPIMTVLMFLLLVIPFVGGRGSARRK